MLEFFQSLSPKLQECVIIIGPILTLGSIVAIVAIVTCTYSKMRTAGWDAGLKAQMIERGMSADDILKILEAKSNPVDLEKSADKLSVKSDPEASLASHLTECWYSAEDVAKILETIHQRSADAQSRKVDFALVRELANQSSEADDIIRILNARHPAAAE